MRTFGEIYSAPVTNKNPKKLYIWLLFAEYEQDGDLFYGAFFSEDDALYKMRSLSTKVDPCDWHLKEIEVKGKNDEV